MHGGWSSNPNERINLFTKPAEGKFQVKTTRRGRRLAGLFLYRNAAQINEPGAFQIEKPRFRFARRIPGDLAVFSLGRTVAITDNGFS
jgi:hypothetical protein